MLALRGEQQFLLDEEGKNLPHRRWSRAEEMAATVPVLRLLEIHRAEVSVVHQRRCLKSLARPFLRQFGCSEFPEFVVHQRQQLLRRAGINILNP